MSNGECRRALDLAAAVKGLSELCRYSEEIAAARSELRGEHADAASAPDLINRVEVIDDVEAQGHRLRIVGKQKLAGDADIDLGVGRDGADVGIAAAQATPRDHVGREPHAAPGCGPWPRPISR
jgi:hypothetical protein